MSAQLFEDLWITRVRMGDGPAALARRARFRVPAGLRYIAPESREITGAFRRTMKVGVRG
jgi:hypothetical protein